MKKLFSPPKPSMGKSSSFKNPWIEEDTNSKIIGYKKLNVSDIITNFETDSKASKMEELKDELQFRIIRNDNCSQSLMWLLEARNIFMCQLSNMSQDYISELVFNRYHKTLIIIYQGVVVGGICFREFEKFAEIAFCAVGNKFHINGFGSYMMALFKTYLQTVGILNIFTYGDDTALVFFHRHGFSKHTGLQSSEWKGYLKDYVNATLLTCKINPQIDYTMIHAALDAMLNTIEKELGMSKINRVTEFPFTRIEGFMVDQRPNRVVEDKNMSAAFAALLNYSKADLFWKVPQQELGSEYSLSKVYKNLIKNTYHSYEEFSNDVIKVFQSVIDNSPDTNTFTKAAKKVIEKAQEILQKYKP
ncbi:acetyltransferase, GNAT family protein [Trichomonas vaginalis G3]|uniref:Acetyltransferase, GNAT family protein n=1 Tax=Trichomonas vaginalis (strain ATCC PRA-98 / G3) TaxID=412133 RepID=A2EGN2_TRIV3|nr:histone acetyltransferase protein [Trichomonas vaginalis G3]EAY08227.1 acetyltransferase, GNAT family protein [Trichomonas vaginalis G3]KAI5519724.1 histone acetyltransferase protein [Trichomonas vaginalis G3]|eukprot:XP_001320450.1 acetyltransferase, GNAT family protein [Trichomonas vaginalis G3]